MSAPEISLDAAGITWRLLATLFFVGANGFFVAAEFALVKVRASRIEELAEKGRERAQAAQHLLTHLDRYLSACQLGITISSLALGALGEPAISRVLLDVIASLGVKLDPASGWLRASAIALAFVVITALHMILGEQVPKLWALRRAEATTLRVSRPLQIFGWFFGPFIAAIDRTSGAVLRLVGVDVTASDFGSHSAEEIRSILSLSARAGQITDRELEITENVFRMIELEVRHIVVPRVDVEWLSLEREPEQNLEAVRQSAHSRLPLCEVGLDTIVGFVHKKDVLSKVLAGETIDLTKLARAPIFVPDTMSVSNFLLELQQKAAHCAAVLDEHGTVIGLAFREDALEEIVGPLGDEFHPPDGAERELVDLGGGCFEVLGRMSLPDACDRLDFELSDDEYEDQDTLGGHVTARLGRMPRRGDAVAVGPFRATVMDIARHRVRKLRLERLEPEQEEEREPVVVE